MTNAIDLPVFSELELEMAGLSGHLMAPAIKLGVADIETARTVCYPLAAECLKRAGRDPDEVDKVLEKALLGVAQPHEGEGVSLPDDLETLVRKTYDDALASEPPGALYRLDEKWVQSISEFRMDIFHDESKHRGRPHVRVTLQDGHINISIEDSPEVLAGKPGLRGETAAIKAVKKHRESLLKFWMETRPDDQKLPPESKKPKAF